MTVGARTLVATYIEKYSALKLLDSKASKAKDSKLSEAKQRKA